MVRILLSLLLQASLSVIISPTRLLELKLSWTREVMQPMRSDRGPDKGREGKGRGAVEVVRDSGQRELVVVEQQLTDKTHT